MIESDGVLTVIGAGQAGAELAVQAREAGWRGRIVLAGDEPSLPYHRPPLSKAYLAGTAALETLAVKAHAAYEQAGIELGFGFRYRPWAHPFPGTVMHLGIVSVGPDAPDVGAVDEVGSVGAFDGQPWRGC